VLLLDNTEFAIVKLWVAPPVLTPTLLSLFARIRIRNFSAGDTIFLKGSPGDQMMAVLNGSVRISVSSGDGRQFKTADARVKLKRLYPRANCKIGLAR
jgi:CRP-like cAMP-binding protein